jgi:hypothetical protein
MPDHKQYEQKFKAGYCGSARNKKYGFKGAINEWNSGFISPG